MWSDLGVEVEDGVEDIMGWDDSKYSEMQKQAFSEVERKLVASWMGHSKEVARSDGSQLNDNIKSVEFKESGLNLGDKEFGTNLFRKVRTVFEFALGWVLEEFVECNYPSSRFADLQKAAVSVLKGKIAKLQEQILKGAVAPPGIEYYRILGERDWRKLKLQAADTKVEGRPKRKVAEAKSPDRATEAAQESTIEEDTDARELFMDHYTDMYLEEQEAYKEHQRVSAEQEVSKKQLQDHIDRFFIISIVIDGVRGAMATLTQKIKASVQQYNRIKNKLSSTITLHRTDEFITNPYETSNLAGIFQILRDEYGTATLSRFNRDFAEVLACPIPVAELIKNPLRASQQTDKRIAEWLQVGSWTFMTIDVFFTNILLGYLPNNEFKQRCVAAVNDYLRKVELGEIKDTIKDNMSVSSSKAGLGLGGMPMYAHLVEFMKVQHESAAFVSITSAKQHPGQQTQNSGPPRHGRQGVSGLDFAAAVNIQSAEEVPFERSTIFRDHTSGQQGRYTATKERCPVCFGKSTGQKVEQHVPRCRSSQCTKCNLFGHVDRYCVQVKHGK